MNTHARATHLATPATTSPSTITQTPAAEQHHCHDVTITRSEDTPQGQRMTLLCFRCPTGDEHPRVIHAPAHQAERAFLEAAMRHSEYTQREIDGILAILAMGTPFDSRNALWELDDLRCHDTACDLHRRHGLF